MKIELAVKFGSNEIIIYRKGFGIIAREPSYVAINKNSKRVSAFGTKAQRKCELKPLKYELCEPIKGIEVVDANLATMLIDYILRQAVLDKGKITALIAVPCALGEKKLLELKIILNNAGISKVHFVQNAVCVRYCMPEEEAKLIVDIGKYLMDVSLCSKHEFMAGRNYILGGAEMDEALATYIEDNFGVRISLEQAEQIKNEVASLYLNDMYTITFKGVNAKDEFQEVTMRANEARVAIIGVYDKLMDLLEEFIQTLNSKMQAKIKAEGITFTGGVCCVEGMIEYASKRLNMPVYVVENPKDAVVLGAGKLLALNIKDCPNIKL